MKLDHIFTNGKHSARAFQPTMKANGAIVMHRPRDEDDSDDSGVDTSPEMEYMSLVHQENIRLKQQLMVERDRFESWRQAKQIVEYELLQTNKEKQALERKLGCCQRAIQKEGHCYQQINCIMSIKYKYS